MIEPVTAFGLSTKILLTTIIINVIEEKTHRILQFKSILSNIQLTFEECSATLLLWKATWANEDMTERARALQC
jgi:hypothetical protein